MKSDKSKYAGHIITKALAGKAIPITEDDVENDSSVYLDWDYFARLNAHAMTFAIMAESAVKNGHLSVEDCAAERERFLAHAKEDIKKNTISDFEFNGRTIPGLSAKDSKQILK